MRWVDPDGHPYEVAEDAFRKFCSDKGLHYDNLIAHVKLPSSDQKCGGWRLVDRVRCIRPVHQPAVTVPALGTVAAFFGDCIGANDGRQNLKDRTNFNKLLGGEVLSAGVYKSGQPYNCWERRQLSADEVWELLCACMKQKPEERPGFAEVASKVGAIRQKGGGALSKWL